MMSPQVLAQGGGGQSKVNTVAPGDDDLICESEIHLNEKRTRFSLSHDQDSLGKILTGPSQTTRIHSVKRWLVPLTPAGFTR